MNKRGRTTLQVCLNCQTTDLSLATKNIEVFSDGTTEVVPAVYGRHCQDCGAVMFFGEDDSGRQLDLTKNLPIQAIAKQAEFVRDTRANFNLSQQEAEEIFGGAAGSFSKYECIEAIPPKALVHLLRILAKHPELLQEVRSF